MVHWLVFWKTWTEDEIETPWDFVLVEKTQDYRLRSNLEQQASQELINLTFESVNQDQITEFLAKYVDAYVLAAVIPATTIDLAYEFVLKYFADAEITNVVQVPEHLLDAVISGIKSPALAGLSSI